METVNSGGRFNDECYIFGNEVFKDVAKSCNDCLYGIGCQVLRRIVPILNLMEQILVIITSKDIY